MEFFIKSKCKHIILLCYNNVASKTEAVRVFERSKYILQQRVPTITGVVRGA
jgi:hypothetical protein